MIVTCDNCATRFRLDDKVVGDRPSFRAKCSRCGHLFTVSRLALAEDPVVLEEGHSIDDRGGFHTITVCNQKGGVAKTSTCINLGASLALLGKKVLLADFDVQANLSVLMGCRNNRSFFDVLEAGKPAELTKAILKVRPNIWVLPSNSRMALSSKKYLNQDGFEYVLQKHLEPVKDFFDYILIDTPPSIDFFTLNALMASDLAVIPTQSEFLAINGVNHIENIIGVIGEKTGHRLDYRILVTMYDQQNMASQVIMKQLRHRYGARVLDLLIARDPRLQESQIVRKPVIYYDKGAVSGRQYLDLARRVDALRRPAAATDAGLGAR